MAQRPAKRVATRLLEARELLSEDEACVRLHTAFPPLWETARTRLSQRYFRARACLRNVFTGPLATQTLVVQTPLGLGVPWRLWGESLQVVPALLQEDGSLVLESWSEGAHPGSSDLWNLWKTGQTPTGVVHIPAEQTARCTFITDRILTELLPWSH
jgi:hypothetical protein